MNTARFSCPWCGETNDILLEPGDAGQEVVQDCSVCCRPIVIVQDVDGHGEAGLVEVRRE